MLRLACVVSLLVACGGGRGGVLPNVDGGSGLQCGGFAGAQCPADELCDFGPNDCGATDGTGTCRARPRSCDDNVDPVCGCNGTTFGNQCDAEAAGQDVSAFGGCPAPANHFECGFRFCDREVSFCHVFGSDVGGEPSVFQCEGLPAACGAVPDCQCLADAQVACADQCEGSAATGLRVTCFGG